MPLEEEYPGDASWQRTVVLYKEDYLGGDLDLAVVLRGKRGLGEGLWWIEQKVPALDNLRPADCLEDPRLIKRLRTALMSMP